MTLRREQMLAVVRELRDRYGRAPVAAEVGRHFSLTEDNTENLLGILVGEGSLIRIGDRYDFPAFGISRVDDALDFAPEAPSTPAIASAEPEIAQPEQSLEAAEELEIEAKPAQDAQKSEASGGPIHGARWQVQAIRIVIGAAGIAASIASAYLVVLRLESFVPQVLAWILGIVLVAFAVIAFETVIVFLQRRQRWAAGFFITVWLVVWSFTLVSCVSGFWGFYQDVRTQGQIATAASDIQRQHLELVRQSEVDLRGQIEQKTREIADLQGLLSSLSSTLALREAKAGIYAETSARLLSREDQLDKMQKQLDGYRAQESTIIAAAPEVVSAPKHADFFEWMSRIIHISADTLELVTALLPAMLVDLMSSTGLAVALFLK